MCLVLLAAHVSLTGFSLAAHGSASPYKLWFNQSQMGAGGTVGDRES